MARHESNAERISRAAAEADAKAREAAKKKAARPPSARSRASGPKPKPRIKVIWAVGRPGLEPVKTFPYAERAAADAESTKRGGDFRVAPLKVPME